MIADTLSKNYCNEFYQLSEGQEDVFLSGKNKFNLANGNAFRFDNNESEEITANRKQGTRKGLIVLIAAIAVGFLIGYAAVSGIIGFGRAFGGKSPEIKTFSSDGMTITLTDEFREANVDFYNVVYESKNAVILVLKEEFALAEGLENYTLEQYADLVIQANDLGSVEIKTADGLTGFDHYFTNPETNETYKYVSYVYKADDAFLLMQFATLDENADAYASEITGWAKSVSFSD